MGYGKMKVEWKKFSFIVVEEKDFLFEKEKNFLFVWRRKIFFILGIYQENFFSPYFTIWLKRTWRGEVNIKNFISGFSFIPLLFISCLTTSQLSNNSYTSLYSLHSLIPPYFFHVLLHILFLTYWQTLTTMVSYNHANWARRFSDWPSSNLATYGGVG